MTRCIEKFRWLAAVVALALLSACDAPTGGGPGAEAVLGVQVIQAEQRDVSLYIDMVGTTLGTQDVPIRARVEGFLETMDFQEGTFVEKGDLLYTIDPQPFQAKLVEAQSMLATAETTRIKAAADLARIKPLAEMKAVSEQDLDAAVAQESAARSAVRASEAAVDLAEIELSYTQIYAPITGLIGLTKAKPGEFVGRDPNPVVLNTLSDIDPIRVRFSISEREYLIMARTYMAENPRTSDDRQSRSKERRSDLVMILADGSEHDQKGHIVAASQAVDQETGTYTLEAAFPNPRKYLLPGQFARIRAKYNVIEDAVVIPKKAISELQGLYRVYLVNPQNEIEVREVELGEETGDDTVIDSGLAAGETIVVEGVQKIRAGMKVKPIPAGQATSGQVK